MSKISIRPKYDWSICPCPKCGENGLAYDGSVKWRSGSRPGRELASKGPVGFSPRADFEIAHYYHCECCGVELYDPLHSYSPHLNIEKDWEH